MVATCLGHKHQPPHNFPRFARPLVILLGLCAQYCSKTVPETRRPEWPEAFKWLGQAPRELDSRDTVVSMGLGLPARSLQARIHRLRFLERDTLLGRLWEFEKDYWAYAFFQQHAPSAGALGRGYYRRGNVLAFHYGRFYGELQYVGKGLVPVTYLRESLAGIDFPRKPEVFASFPRLNRFENSERVQWGHPLGMPGRVPLFSAGYPCGADTALVFRLEVDGADGMLAAWSRHWEGSLDTLAWGRELLFWGFTDIGEPILVYAGKGGMFGIRGCPDQDQAEIYAEIMRKMTILLKDP